MASFINMKNCKSLALASAERRYKKFTRFRSKEWGEYLDGEVRRIIVSAVESAPTVGKTLYPPVRCAKVPENT